MDQYQQIRELGSGAFGKTYLVQKDDRLYTLKVGRDQIGVILLGREAKILERIQSDCINHLPCLVDVIRDPVTERVNAIITEYIQGDTLDKFRDLSLDEIDEIATDLLVALTTIHSLGIVHRDLKMENIVFDRDNRNAFLIDFGAAITGDTSSFAGSSRHISPEMYQTTRPFTLDQMKRSDLYALGMILYRLVNQRKNPYPVIEHEAGFSSPFDYSQFRPSEYSVSGISFAGHTSEDVNSLLTNLLLEPSSAKAVLTNWALFFFLSFQKEKWFT